ncbi:MAG: bioY [Gammaproteobacteria bacterium]|jgi:biotin transport system substrate-specific component|nr:bioY [Gammaproteobacteria bacterium]
MRALFLNNVKVLFLSRGIRMALAFIAICIVAQLSIPLKPVPITFQDSAILLLAMLLPETEILIVVSTYLVLGTIGLPIFAGFSAGWPVLLGPTGGYLLGFLPAALLANCMLAWFKTRSLLSYFTSAALGTLIVFVFGIAWLAHLVGLSAAYHFGLVPFLLTETIKLLSLVLLLKVLHR